MPLFRVTALGVVALSLAACGAIPDLRMPRRAAAPSAMTTGPIAPAEPLATAPGTAGAAEAACLAAGRERGFEVQGVVGSTDVTGGDGVALSRDVMLRVVRSGQQFDLRCNYVYADGIARVMAL